MPKAFLSHSSLDQERFVLGLAERLQANGVETWYSGWELLDGDSLSDRIFEQGIGEADIFIVVLSQNTLDSKWVKAELAVGLVQRIEEDCRLIPIVLDGVKPPVALKDTFQRRIANVDDYDTEFDALLRSIFKRPTTPPLGEPPAYAAAPTIKGLRATDAIVHAELAELAIETGTFLIHGSQLNPRCAARGLTDDAVVEAIHALDAKGLLKDALVLGTVRRVHIHPRLVREHVAMTTDVNALERQLIAAIVNRTEPGRPEVGMIAQEVGVDRIVAQAVLDRRSGRLFKLSPRINGPTYIENISPLLERELDP